MDQRPAGLGEVLLVLTRKVGESIVIDDEVTVTILEVAGRNIKVGIDAPKTRRIVRPEAVSGAKARTPRAALKTRDQGQRR